MDISEIDGSVFLYNPRKDNDLKKLQNSHEDFQADLDDLESSRKTLLRFIILMWDINTPLRLTYKDYFKRKANAALMAGFKRNAKSKKFKEPVVNAMLGKSDAVNGMIVRYLMYFYNEDYLQHIIYWELLGQFGRSRLSQSIDKSKIEAFENIKKTITDLSKKIFGGDESRELKKELYRALEMEKESLHPDNVAFELQNNPEIFKEEYE